MCLAMTDSVNSKHTRNFIVLMRGQFYSQKIENILFMTVSYHMFGLKHFNIIILLQLYMYVYKYLDIQSSPFHLVMAQSQYLLVIERDGGFNTLYHNCGFAYQRRVLKTYPALAISSLRMGQSDYDISWKNWIYIQFTI